MNLNKNIAACRRRRRRRHLLPSLFFRQPLLISRSACKTPNPRIHSRLVGLSFHHPSSHPPPPPPSHLVDYSRAALHSRALAMLPSSPPLSHRTHCAAAHRNAHKLHTTDVSPSLSGASGVVNSERKWARGCTIRDVRACHSADAARSVFMMVTAMSSIFETRGLNDNVTEEIDATLHKPW